MTGNEAAFAELDKGVSGIVKFGDGSLMAIKGRGTLLFAVTGDEHRALTQVYWIPRLKSNIVSIRQLDKIGCPTHVEGGFMTVCDRQRRILAKVPRSRNRLYIVRLQLVKPVCLAAHVGEDGWLWHARFGHQHFDGLGRLARQGMVRGLPLIEHVEQVCDACLIGKQRRSPFPLQAKYRATEPLELVHGDLCGPISPATPDGKKYFLLLVDDHSRHMWLFLLRSKDEAAEAIQRFQARVERETGRKLKTLMTDHGGEFNSNDFAAYLADLGLQRHLTAPYTP
jgi:transposase InsO family protein